MANGNKQISSRFGTIFCKYFGLAFFSIVIGFFLFSHFYLPPVHGSELNLALKFVPLYFVVVLFILLRIGFRTADYAELTSSGFYFKRRGRMLTVRFEEIASISLNRREGMAMVDCCQTTAFGKTIYFVPNRFFCQNTMQFTVEELKRLYKKL